MSVRNWFKRGRKGSGDRYDNRPPVNAPVPTTVVVSPSSFTIVTSGTQQLSATIYDQFSAVYSAPVTWESSNPAVATVSSGGLVAFVSAGTATITARSPMNLAQGTSIATMSTVTPPAAAVTGTATSSFTESQIVAGGRTIILTLTNDTWVPAGATFNAQRQNIINGIVSAQAEAAGWNAVRFNLPVTNVVRTSSTVVTITLSALSSYVTTANETLTITIPGTAVTGGVGIGATPTLTATTDVATKLAMATQPAGAVVDTPFTTQPAIQLQTAGSTSARVPGVTVTATKHSGVVGTLSGTLTAVSNAAGLATFTDLEFDSEESGVSIDFSAGGLTGVTSAALTVTAGGWLANKPGSYTMLREIDFSQSVPAGAPGGRSISGASGWNLVFDDDIYGPGVSNFTQISDGTEPQSPPSAWRLTFEAGDYGTFGTGEGHGAGNIWTSLPGSCSKLYFCYTCRWNTGYLWHGISNKHINIFTNGGGVFLIQAYETGGWWMRAHNLSSPDTLYPVSNNSPLTLGDWHTIEGQIEVGNPGIVKVWVDGIIRTNSTALIVPQTMAEFGIYGYRGGGGEDLADTISYDLGHLYLATG